jgi:hypothetical protein
MVPKGANAVQTWVKVQFCYGTALAKPNSHTEEVTHGGFYPTATTPASRNRTATAVRSPPLCGTPRGAEHLPKDCQIFMLTASQESGLSRSGAPPSLSFCRLWRSIVMSRLLVPTSASPETRKKITCTVHCLESDLSASSSVVGVHKA